MINMRQAGVFVATALLSGAFVAGSADTASDASKGRNAHLRSEVRTGAAMEGTADDRFAAAEAALR